MDGRDVSVRIDRMPFTVDYGQSTGPTVIGCFGFVMHSRGGWDSFTSPVPHRQHYTTLVGPAFLDGCLMSFSF